MRRIWIAASAGLALLGCGGKGPSPSGAAGGGGGLPAGIPSLALSAGNGVELVSVYGPGGTIGTGQHVAPFNLALDDTGAATIAQGGALSHASVPQPVAAQLFADLHAAGALEHLKINAKCANSVFPDIYVRFATGSSSPDLKCPGDATSQRVVDDLILVTDSLGIFAGS